LKRSLFIIIMGILILAGCSSSVDIDGEKITYEELQDKIEKGQDHLEEIESTITKSENELEDLKEKEKNY